MSFRRTVLACAVTFVGALAVFTLPRFAWNSLQGAIRPPAAPDAVLPPPAIAPLVAQAAPRSAGQRLTGLFGIVLILGIGMALSRNRDRKSTRLNSSHDQISYAVFCLKKKNNTILWSREEDYIYVQHTKSKTIASALRQLAPLPSSSPVIAPPGTWESCVARLLVEPRYY